MHHGRLGCVQVRIQDRSRHPRQPGEESPDLGGPQRRSDAVAVVDVDADDGVGDDDVNDDADEWR